MLFGGRALGTPPEDVAGMEEQQQQQMQTQNEDVDAGVSATNVEDMGLLCVEMNTLFFFQCMRWLVNLSVM